MGHLPGCPSYSRCECPQWVATGRSGRRNFGAGDLLEVQQADAPKSLIPFKSGIADLQDGRIVLDLELLA
jgi:hypothetical protein